MRIPFTDYNVLSDVEVLELAKSNRREKSKQYGVPTDEKLKRVNKADLELAYARDDVIHNGVNLYVLSMMSVDYSYKCANERDLEIMLEFDKNTNMEWILMSTFKHNAIYGDSWEELVRGSKGKKLVSLGKRDPKSMDFMRGTMGEITYNEYNQPAGYVQFLPENWKGNVPDGRLGTQDGKPCIKFNREEIVHHTYMTAEDNLSGIGMVEPQYDLVRIKKNIEKAYGQFIFDSGFPVRVIYIGDKDKHTKVTPADREWALKEMDRLDDDNNAVLPYYMKLEMVGPDAKKFSVDMNYWVDRQVTVIGAPKALVTGSGEDTNRSTLEWQMSLWERKIFSHWKHINESYVNGPFKILAEDYDMEEIPQFEIKDLSLRSMSDFADRLATYSNAGLITPKPWLEETILKLEKLEDDVK